LLPYFLVLTIDVSNTANNDTVVRDTVQQVSGAQPPS
jgi:hypothetical protein